MAIRATYSDRSMEAGLLGRATLIIDSQQEADVFQEALSDVLGVRESVLALAQGKFKSNKISEKQYYRRVTSNLNIAEEKLEELSKKYITNYEEVVLAVKFNEEKCSLFMEAYMIDKDRLLN